MRRDFPQAFAPASISKVTMFIIFYHHLSYTQGNSHLHLGSFSVHFFGLEEAGETGVRTPCRHEQNRRHRIKPAARWQCCVPPKSRPEYWVPRSNKVGTIFIVLGMTRLEPTSSQPVHLSVAQSGGCSTARPVSWWESDGGVTMSK